MRDYLKEFSGDVIGDFLVENDIKDILNEASPGKNSPTDDGPPTFYHSLGQYKKETEDWITQLQNDLGSLREMDSKDYKMIAEWAVAELLSNELTTLDTIESIQTGAEDELRI